MDPGAGLDPHLLHVDSTRQQVGGDQHAGGSRAELAHDDITGVLVHVSVRGRDGMVTLAHLLGQPVDLAARVGEDDRLGNGEGLVEVAQRLELPVLLLHVDVELRTGVWGGGDVGNRKKCELSVVLSFLVMVEEKK